MFTILNAQERGSIHGEVQELSTKDFLPGVNVFIEGTTIGASTDINGHFEINNVPAGSHKLVCSFLGYVKQIKDIEVTAGKTVTVNFVLEESSQRLGEVEIVSQRATATENAVMLEMKDAKQLISGVSRQQISRSQDSDAAKVMQRVPGITIVGNRFVMIRGVAERYNQVLINDVIAPSTEVDRRTFSFDLIQSDAIDRMIINKTASADTPGDFAGGVIKVYTINYVDEDFTNVNLGLGYRVGTTFQDFYMSNGSNTDFIALDNSFRPLPADFPITRVMKESPRNATLRQTAAHSLPNNWNPIRSTVLPNYSFGVSLGRKKTFENGSKLVSTNNLSYSKKFQNIVRDFTRYDAWTDFSEPINLFFKFEDDMYEEETSISAMSNWSYIINSRHSIKFSNLFNQIAEERTTLRSGVNFFRPDELRKDYLLGFRSRTIYSGQFEGKHEFSPVNNLRWVTGGSFLGENEPDLRRFRTYTENTGPGAENGIFTMILPPSSNLFDASRYYGKLKEFSVNNGLDYTHTLAESSRGKMELKGGTYVDYRKRDFNSRYFSFLYPGFSDPVIGEQLSQLPLDVIFSNENVTPADGFILEEGTRPIDSYASSNFLMSGYAMISAPIGLLNIIGGLRVENNQQKLDAQDDLGPIKIDNTVLSFLPSLNLSYSITERSLIRAAYSRTVNRPEFRELAPFLFYDYQLDAGRAGNPNLETATIDNFDLRYEIYPRLGEVVSLGAFYKRFDKPIENITNITTEQPQFTYANADYAENLGVEFEFRKSFKQVFNSPFLDRMSANVNASYIWSEVNLGAAAINQEQVRPLQGQSPYIINLGLSYLDNANKFSVSAYYNIFGDRIFSVGDVLFPTIFELPRNSLDITITKEINKMIAIKAGVRDLLNAQYRFVQDSNRDARIDTDVDDTVFAFRMGQLISLSATFKLHKE